MRAKSSMDFYFFSCNFSINLCSLHLHSLFSSQRVGAADDGWPEAEGRFFALEVLHITVRILGWQEGRMPYVGTDGSGCFGEDGKCPAWLLEVFPQRTYCTLVQPWSEIFLPALLNRIVSPRSPYELLKDMSYRWWGLRWIVIRNMKKCQDACKTNTSTQEGC